jgi:hypothetical protein
MMAGTDTSPTKRAFHCSFCGKSQFDVAKLIAGPGVHICDACVDLCVPIMAAAPSEPMEPNAIMTPERLSTDQLLRSLTTFNGASERVDAFMQDLADILREREISWAAIGEALGVSRQAAWKRFG